MPIDLNLLDKYKDYSEESEEALGNFIETLVEQFLDSPEGQSHLVDCPDADFWANSLLEYGYQYESFTPARMTSNDVEYVVTNLFPRKITLATREDAEDAIPELKAFWHYLKREYALKQADSIIKSLDKIAPQFADLMFDKSKAGMAKSMMMAGYESGFDMSDPDEMNKFILLHNAQQLQELKNESRPSRRSWNPFGLPEPSPEEERAAKAKKNKRKAAKASKKKNRKKKRK